jgi:hypothetical protein
MSTDIQNKVQRLEAYNESPAPILSLYFKPVNWREDKELLINQLQTVIDKHLSYQEREQAKNNIAYIEGFLMKYTPDPREQTLAIFSGGDSLFEIIHVLKDLPNQAKLLHDPFLEPILQEQTTNQRYLVIAVDRKRAFFFILRDSVIENQDAIIDDTVPQNVKGRWPEAQYAQREDKIQRHIIDHLHRHFMTIADEVKRFVGAKKIAGVILGGHKNEFSQFKKCLPKALQEKIVGEFVSELNVDLPELQEKAKRIIKKTDNQYLHQTYSSQL